jgi:hypothetical protein
VQHADVKLLTIVERVGPKTVGVEQLLAAIGTASTASATSGRRLLLAQRRFASTVSRSRRSEFFNLPDSQYLRQHYTRLSIIESQGG